jgi:hypothetical protein
MASSIDGYLQISQLMSQHTEMAVVRRFGNLNMLNILHLQAELMHLEEKYYRLAESDAKSSSRPYRARDWWSLTQPDCNGRKEQWETLLEIREKLAQYSEVKIF